MLVHRFLYRNFCRCLVGHCLVCAHIVLWIRPGADADLHLQGLPLSWFVLKGMVNKPESGSSHLRCCAILALGCAGSCEIVRQVVKFFEENADESIVDSSKLYQGCSIEMVRH